MTRSKDCDPAHPDRVKNEAHYRNLVELAADAIYVGDSSGNIISANQSATDLTGYPLGELLGMNLGRLFSEEEHARVPLRYDLLKAGKIVQTERMLTRRDGSSVAVGMNSRMMPDGSYHCFMRDSTERKANEEQMLSLIRDLEAFTYTVSHDLRTPLSSVLMATEILEKRCEEELDESSMKLLRVISSSAVDMFALVENLISLARAERTPRPSEPIDGNKILNKVIDDLTHRIESDGVTLDASSVPDMKIPETFVGQIFHNLIGNALNYASDQGSRIEVGGELQGKKVRLYVRDHGPGIPVAEHGRVFEIFYRGNSSSSRFGSGLGLSIVDKIARAFDGSAWVEETPGGGCTFWVEMEGSA